MNLIRFQAFDGNDLVAQSEWLPESTSNCAPNALATFRKQHSGNFAYRIERTGDSKVPNPVKMYRYRIKVGDDVFYSKLFTETEKDGAIAEIRNDEFLKGKYSPQMLANAEITEGVQQ